MKDRNAIGRKQFLVRTGGILAAGVGPLIRTNPAKAAGVRYRTLGKTGLKVTEVALGGSRTSEPSVVKRALDLGVNFIDTGRMYSGGRNEEMIGRVVSEVGGGIIIQSKIDQKIQNNPAAMARSIEESLRALRTDTIDIMLIRGATTGTAVRNNAVHEAFERAKEAGKIRFCGFSCHSANAPEMVRTGVDTGWYDVIMVPYNHSGSFTHSIYGIYSEWNQKALESSFAYAASKGVGVAVMKTCSGGPFKKPGEARGTFSEGLKWNLRNRDVGVMAVGMASFREVDEDVGVMA